MLSPHTPKNPKIWIIILDIPIWWKVCRRRLVWSFADTKAIIILRLNSSTILKKAWFIFHYLYTRLVPEWIKGFPKDIVSKISLLSLIGNGGREFLKGELSPSPAPLIKGRLPPNLNGFGDFIHIFPWLLYTKMVQSCITSLCQATSCYWLMSCHFLIPGRNGS